ncbi:MAG: tetratricopeptide repeat protein [Candidatus Thorarchaeota archaeon]|nr:tetratricopeptide repeat protein [Candidatus Thorarchaeota archaeon]
MSQDKRSILAQVDVLEREEQYHKAEALLRNNVASLASDHELGLRYALILVKLGRDRDAERTLRQLLSQHPDDTATLIALGRLLDNSLRTKEAETLYRSFMEKHPDSHEVMDELCQLLVSEDRKDEALESARRHAMIYSTDYHAYDALRHVLMECSEDCQEALDDEDDKETALEMAASNLLEQLRVLGEVKSAVEHAPPDPAVRQELEEEARRLLGEAEDLERWSKWNKVRLPRGFKTEVARVTGLVLSK